MMIYFRWVVFNFVVLGMVADGLFGLSPYSHYSQNLIPFLAFMLLVISFLGMGLIIFMWVIEDELEGEDRYRMKAKIKRTPKFLRVVNTIFDLSLVFILASFAFYFSAVAYLFHWVFGLIGVLVKNSLVEKLNAK